MRTSTALVCETLKRWGSLGSKDLPSAGLPGWHWATEVFSVLNTYEPIWRGQKRSFALKSFCIFHQGSIPVPKPRVHLPAVNRKSKNRIWEECEAYPASEGPASLSKDLRPPFYSSFRSLGSSALQTSYLSLAKRVEVPLQF